MDRNHLAALVALTLVLLPAAAASPPGSALDSSCTGRYEKPTSGPSFCAGIWQDGSGNVECVGIYFDQSGLCVGVPL